MADVRRLEPGDWPAVRAAFLAGIATGDATFEVDAPSWERWDARHPAPHRLVAVEVREVVGWTALSPVSDRAVYAGVQEESLYLLPAARGRGLGRRLLDALVGQSEAAGIWTLQASVFPENAASRALHAAAGFRQVGVRERIGRDASGRWRTCCCSSAARPAPTDSPSERRDLPGARGPVRLPSGFVALTPAVGRHLGRMVARPARASCAEHQHRAEEHADGEQDRQEDHARTVAPAPRHSLTRARSGLHAGPRRGRAA